MLVCAVQTKEEIEKVHQFLFPTMEELYPFPLTENSKKDVADMETLFIKCKNATFIAAFSNKEVVGTIAIRPYDNRIQEMKGRYHLESTCEVIKCYVDKNFRRRGVGSLLFEEALHFCQHAGFNVMYLHTHHFLPGGLSFWKKKGFHVILDQRDELQTVHMEKKL